MNERIDELAEQCSIEEYNQHGDLIEFGFNYEKFAELIVADSIGVLQKRFMGDLNREDMEVRRCIEDLKKHFGVEV